MITLARALDVYLWRPWAMMFLTMLSGNRWSAHSSRICRLQVAMEIVGGSRQHTHRVADFCCRFTCLTKEGLMVDVHAVIHPQFEVLPRAGI